MGLKMKIIFSHTVQLEARAKTGDVGSFRMHSLIAFDRLEG
jgi:hypothetical protein